MQYVRSILVLAIAALVGYEVFEWTVNRVYVPEGKSLLLRYKGPLVFTWRTKKAEIGQFADETKGEMGVLERLRGPGRHFYCPIWWERKLVDDVVVHSGEIAILNSMLGEEGAERKEGQFLVAGDIGHTQQKGTLRRVLGPGRYRINPYAYETTIEKTKVVDTGNNQLKHSGWVQIPAGYVGVQTYLTDDPLASAAPASRTTSSRRACMRSTPKNGRSTSSPSASTPRKSPPRNRRTTAARSSSTRAARGCPCRTRAFVFPPATASRSTWISASCGACCPTNVPR